MQVILLFQLSITLFIPIKVQIHQISLFLASDNRQGYPSALRATFADIKKVPLRQTLTPLVEALPSTNPPWLNHYGGPYSKRLGSFNLTRHPRHAFQFQATSAKPSHPNAANSPKYPHDGLSHSSPNLCDPSREQRRACKSSRKSRWQRALCRVIWGFWTVSPSHPSPHPLLRPIKVQERKANR